MQILKCINGDLRYFHLQLNAVHFRMIVINFDVFCSFLQCLFFPTVAANGNGGQKFSFSITEFEGSQGSFEMVQQSQGRLEAQGQMSNKMHIHANDDVYETTKHRMAVAEENHKNKW